MSLRMTTVALLMSIALIVEIGFFFRSEKKRIQDANDEASQLKSSIRQNILTNIGAHPCDSQPDGALAQQLQTNSKVINSGPDYCTEGFKYDLTLFSKNKYAVDFLITDGKE